MRHWLLPLVIGLALLCSLDAPLAQTPPPIVEWSPSQSRRVTITRGGVVLLTFTTITGTRLVASYDRRQAISEGPLRWELHGDVTLWTGRYEAEPVRSAVGGVITEEWLRNAPVTLNVKDADVLVESNVSN
jgi:hypothetical protein